MVDVRSLDDYWLLRPRRRIGPRSVEVSPSQLVFGVNPRVAGELDEMLDPSGDQITAAPEFRKAARMHDAPRDQRSSKEAMVKIREASVKRHGDRKFAQGQRVYGVRVEKAALRGIGQDGKGRWIGAGVVTIQNSHTVWVGMWRRIWKCNSD